ncbi:large ribosomal subunit protein bL34m [Erinaceus europaeus]|uniref:Large ribosomal subunit protein bL34m n=1 Tax=Erinaceus europaeus TaxID=9365 RepID=A0ABM3WPB0_ERIEU|nr:large ribosomal subunit protein bL34m [Erinaceus europaeus]
MDCTHAYAWDVLFASLPQGCVKNVLPTRSAQAHDHNSRRPPHAGPKLQFPGVFAETPSWGRGDRGRDMASLLASLGRLWGPRSGSAALLGGRCPQPWGGPGVQPSRGRTRGTEYQPSNIKRKHKHGWTRRLSSPAGVQVVLRRMCKGRKSLSH